MEEYSYVVNVDGVVIQNDKYLLIERGSNEAHASGLLTFPGGKVEQQPGGEDTIETTATRELYEEVGIEIGDVEYVFSTTFETDNGTPCINVVTLCELVAGEAYPRASDEVAAVHWFSSREIKECSEVPTFIEQFIERIETYCSKN
ncbi:NUDIX hydrolase [Haladaptatus sp. CMAA 1911]|uniref:NUDIX hydrolase n=1 Tax=unclassified Haladaptatus TaxID=2622732 RepID=UPI0037551C68